MPNLFYQVVSKPLTHTVHTETGPILFVTNGYNQNQSDTHEMGQDIADYIENTYGNTAIGDFTVVTINWDSSPNSPILLRGGLQKDFSATMFGTEIPMPYVGFGFDDHVTPNAIGSGVHTGDFITALRDLQSKENPENDHILPSLLMHGYSAGSIVVAQAIQSADDEIVFDGVLMYVAAVPEGDTSGDGQFNDLETAKIHSLYVANTGLDTVNTIANASRGFDEQSLGGMNTGQFNNSDILAARDDNDLRTVYIHPDQMLNPSDPKWQRIWQAWSAKSLTGHPPANPETSDFGSYALDQFITEQINNTQGE